MSEWITNEDADLSHWPTCKHGWLGATCGQAHPYEAEVTSLVRGPCVYCGNTEGPFKPHHGGDPVCQDDQACLSRGYRKIVSEYEPTEAEEAYMAEHHPTALLTVEPAPACTCDWPPGNPMAVHRSWCPARDPQAPAASPRRAGEAAERPSPRRDDAATPGTPPVVPRGSGGVPGPGSPPPPLPGQQEGGGGDQAPRSGRRQDDAAPGTGVQEWRKTLADQAKARRNRRGTRSGPPITGVRWRPPSGGER